MDGPAPEAKHAAPAKVSRHREPKLTPESKPAAAQASRRAGRKPAPVPAPAKAAEPCPTETAADEAPSEVEQSLREWIVGGDAEDDRRADAEMIQLFEHGTPRELAAARAALAGFGPGLLYRLAARAVASPRLLDGVSRVADGEMLGRIVGDAAHYDPETFARQIAERARRRGEGPSGAVDEAVLRVLREGPPTTRSALIRELRALDPGLAAELCRSDIAPGAAA